MLYKYIAYYLAPKHISSRHCLISRKIKLYEHNHYISGGVSV
jgi:hypothetical protein